MRNRILLLIILLVPKMALACACGCGVFDVQTGMMLPTGEGGTVWAEYDFMNQNVNWSRTSSSGAENNDDKVLRSQFFVLGGQYMFNRDWGVTATVPYTDRYFSTTDDDGNIAGFRHDNFGDVRVGGIYSGFSPDMSTGVTFGMKLPTGDYSYANFDRDSAIGSGSTDLLLGAYHMGRITADNIWGWFVNGQIDQPFLITAGYRPGTEVDAAGGVYYEKWSIAGIKITPIAQILGSYRLSDRGPAANPDNSGYKRVLLSPGVEVAVKAWRLDTFVSLPIYQDVTGNQLTAPVFFKVALSRNF